MAGVLDDAAASLLAVWEQSRERTTSQLSGVQLRVVMAVAEHDGINLRRLAGMLGMLLSSASRLCDRLVAAGMLEREPGRLDRREISLHLTPEAVRLLADLRADRRARLARVLARMTPAGREALVRGLVEFDAVARRLATSADPAEPTDLTDPAEPTDLTDPAESTDLTGPTDLADPAHLAGPAEQREPTPGPQPFRRTA
ncbi:MarR family winged helix-turn-helix transcriptional regulator [Micromonospora sp. WMMD882]|uniref:MarR family winged helix-turn-helix transcriptional regulator n=1 Tax=Micromonospora sp. WMMD882 TaxID=3015151 RepID=UPI00248CD469|nr:MarR family winged helix-turn-helix transcriptional regulator [Micromonospora sp. WMMD882]WBB79512.1 MarR family winged helix-turn-helix transcriptional regulator [Micromonospora sp. WMMD882]